jgi:ankyrin repeat protein
VPCFFILRPEDDSIITHPANDNAKPVPSTVKKSVRFSPEVILLDVCTRGDDDDDDSVNDLMAVIHPPRLVPYWDHRLDGPSSLLHLSLLHRRLDVARALISLGADVTKTDAHGCTPLHYAATLKLWPLVALLARHPDTLVHARNHAGLTAGECPRLWIDQRKCRGKEH